MIINNKKTKPFTKLDRYDRVYRYCKKETHLQILIAVMMAVAGLVGAALAEEPDVALTDEHGNYTYMDSNGVIRHGYNPAWN